MTQKTVGFIGGGRITRIMLEGWSKAGVLPQRVFVSDTDSVVLERLKAQYPGINTVLSDNARAASQDVVFLALHPPLIKESLAEIEAALQPGAIMVSLAPKFSLAKLSQLLGGFQRLVRMIPNAPSIVNSGYNPAVFSAALSETEKEQLRALLGTLGQCPEVPEEHLEAYAIVTAMGPTYLWFQFQTLQTLASSFGLSEEALQEAMPAMLTGAVNTMYAEGLTPEQVMDLVPVKPLGDEEQTIQAMYQTKLKGIFQKLTA